METHERSKVLSSEQRLLLLNMIRERNNIINDHSTGATVAMKKRQAWVAICKDFNALYPEYSRTPLQLKRSFDHVKRKVKQEDVAYKKKLGMTGGGAPPDPPKPNEEMAMMSDELAMDVFDVFDTFVHPLDETGEPLLDVTIGVQDPSSTFNPAGKQVLDRSYQKPSTYAHSSTRKLVYEQPSVSTQSSEHVVASTSRTPSPTDPSMTTLFVATDEPLADYGIYTTSSPTGDIRVRTPTQDIRVRTPAQDVRFRTPTQDVRVRTPTPSTSRLSSSKKRLEDEYSKCSARQDEMHKLKMDIAKCHLEMAKQEHAAKMKLNSEKIASLQKLNAEKSDILQKTHRETSELLQQISVGVEDTQRRLGTTLNKIDSFVASAKYAYETMAKSYE